MPASFFPPRSTLFWALLLFSVILFLPVPCTRRLDRRLGA